MTTPQAADALARSLGGALTPLEHVSPSQIATFRDCQRKHFFAKRFALPQPAKPAAELGTRVHEVLDARLTEGRWAGDPLLAREVLIARGGFGHLPKGIDTLHKEVEEAMTLQGAALPMRGRVDLVLPSLSTVIDHKTTSDKRWAKSAEDLRVDPQSICYSLWAQQAYDLPWPVTFSHVYYLTRGQPRGFAVSVQWRKRGLQRGWERVRGVVQQIYDVTRGHDPAAVTPNFDACSKYGGCPFVAACTSVQAQDKEMPMATDDLFTSLRKHKDSQADDRQRLGLTSSGSGNNGKKTLISAIERMPSAAQEEADEGALNPPDAPAPVKVEVVVEKKKKAKPRRSPGTLYVGCIPVGEKVTMLEEIADPLLAGIAEGAGKAHYLSVEFGKWKGAFAARLVGWLDDNPLPKALVVMPYTPCASTALEVLRLRYPHVVERVG